MNPQLNYKIDLVCQLCGSEVQEYDDVILGMKDDVNKFDLNQSEFSFIHLNCIRNKKVEKNVS